ncbi:MAG: RnfABCDGE type electron transport complex subunit D [Dehalococcoidia bacterium]
MASIRHALRSPKGYMLALVLSLAALGSAATGAGQTLPGLAASVAAAAVTDVLARAATRRAFEFPGGAILTGLVVAMILDPYAPVHVAAVAAATGIAAKHLLRAGSANIFNPAVLGLVLAHLLFGQGESWWGALPGYGVLGLLVVLLPGIWIADYVNKLPLVLTFLGTYFSLFTLTGLGPAGIEVAEIFRSPGVHMAVFFAFYMLDDPPTSPARYRDQLWYGALVAAMAYALFMTTGVVYYLVGALLAGNVANSLRVAVRIRQQHAPGAAAQ